MAPGTPSVPGTRVLPLRHGPVPDGSAVDTGRHRRTITSLVDRDPVAWGGARTAEVGSADAVPEPR